MCPDRITYNRAVKRGSLGASFAVKYWQVRVFCRLVSQIDCQNASLYGLKPLHIFMDFFCVIGLVDDLYQYWEFQDELLNYIKILFSKADTSIHIILRMDINILYPIFYNHNNMECPGCGRFTWRGSIWKETIKLSGYNILLVQIL